MNEVENTKRHLKDVLTNEVIVNQTCRLTTIDSNTLQPKLVVTLEIALPLEAVMDSKSLLTEDDVYNIIGKKVLDAAKQDIVPEWDGMS